MSLSFKTVISWGFGWKQRSKNKKLHHIQYMYGGKVKEMKELWLTAGSRSLTWARASPRNIPEGRTTGRPLLWFLLAGNFWLEVDRGSATEPVPDLAVLIQSSDPQWPFAPFYCKLYYLFFKILLNEILKFGWILSLGHFCWKWQQLKTVIVWK